jgi:hypothetical protein
MLKGIDISHYQDTTVRYQDYDFIIMKASEGANWKDPRMKQHLIGVQCNCKLYGFYHYARPEYNADAKVEARHFVETIRPYVGDCLLALDWEGNSLKYPISWPHQWLDEVYRLTGVRPVIYVQESEITKRDYSSIVKDNYGLWVAKWGKNTPKTGAWKFYALWQYQGSPLDKDYFQGSVEQFKKYCKVDGKPTKQYYPTCPRNETSIIDYLKSINVDSSLDNRRKIASKNGIKKYVGNYEQNVKLLALAKKGKLVK